MRSHILYCLVLIAIVASLGATTETEPNNTYDAAGVLWCDNGTHDGAFSYTGDMDFWYFYVFPGDNVTISTMGLTTLDTVIEIRKESGIIVAQNDDYGGTVQSRVTYTTSTDDVLYLRLREKNSQTGSYGFSVTGLFISYNNPPDAPFNFSISNGANGVDPLSSSITWTWGDGSHAGHWMFFFGMTAESMTPITSNLMLIEERNGSIMLPEALIGGFTYYFKIEYSGMLGDPGDMAVYSFSTAPLMLALPFTENFDAPTYMFANVTPESPWFQIPPEEGNPGAMVSITSPSATSILLEKGAHNLVGTSGAYMTFRHLAWMEPQDDHAYVEYSADGGQTWAVFPASAYQGSGVYNMPSGNNPEGPCFDAGSYENWADYQNLTEATGYWHTETFNLSPWAGSSNFRIRFRTVFDGDEVGLGWIVDDVIVTAVIIPPPEAPQNVWIKRIGEDIRLQWDNVPGATGYLVYSADDPYGPFNVDYTGVFSGAKWTCPQPAGNKYYHVTAVRD